MYFSISKDGFPRLDSKILCIDKNGVLWTARYENNCEFFLRSSKPKFVNIMSKMQFEIKDVVGYVYVDDIHEKLEEKCYSDLKRKKEGTRSK